ncbi:hypothetical protein [Megasphaera sp.]|nr:MULTISPECIES: hypothetical protein [unclassified Megasphaera]
MANDNEPEDPTPPTASLTLSNGKKYDETSTSYQFDREVSDSTGTITVKALFNNADGVLLPGMFARVTMEGPPLEGCHPRASACGPAGPGPVLRHRRRER